MANLFFSRQFIIFLLTGGLAALINYLSRILLSTAGMDFRYAVVSAYLIGMAVAYLLFRLVVFRHSTTPLSRSLLAFTAVNLLGMLLTYLVSTVLYYHALPALTITWRPAEIAHFIGIAVPAFTSFIGHKYFSFRESTIS